MLIAFLLLRLVYSERLVNFKFFKNFGQVFHDFSDKRFDAINGEVLPVDYKDTVPTDRGAYFDEGNKEINLPLTNYEDEELIEDSKFAIVAWLKIQTSTTRFLVDSSPTKHSNIFIINSNTGLKLGIYLMSNLKIQVSIQKSSSLLSYLSVGTISSSQWQFLAVSIDDNNLKLYINNAEDFSKSDSALYAYGDESAVYIGHKDSVDSFNGYLFELKLVTSFVLSDHVASSSTTCLTAGCSSSCSPAVILGDNVAYCLSNQLEYNKNSQGTDCPGDCPYGCINSTCLDCQCEYLTCTAKSGSSQCWCPDGIEPSSTSCDCGEEVFDGIECIDLSSCNDLCGVCDGSGCLYCKDYNGVPIGNTCTCSDYYVYSLASYSNYCKKCPDTCLTCDTGGKCTSCISQNAVIKNGICQCMQGYYASDSSLQNIDSCQECNSNCTTCSKYPKCDTCSTVFANPDSLYGCACPSNSIEVNNMCECIDGYNISTASDLTYCYKCHSTCLTCDGTSKKSCLSCKPDLNYNEGLCTCNETLYWNGTDCVNCEKFCEICQSGLKCTQCISGFYLGDDGHCAKNCSDGSYFNGTECVLCDKLCMSCNADGCLVCADNSIFYNGSCVCQQGFKGEESCEQQYFEGSLYKNSSNIILLIFTKPLSSQLYSDDFSVSTPNIKLEFSWFFYYQNNQTYKFRINPSSDIPSNTLLSIQITKNSTITSTENYELLNKTFSIELDEYSKPYKSSQATQKLSNITSGLAKGAISSSIFSGLFSTPAFLWSFLNTLELIALLPLNAIPYPSTLSYFFNSFVGFNIFPNPMTYLQSSSNLPVPYKEAKNYGFDTSLFHYNGGTYLWVFGVCLIGMLIFYLGKRVENDIVSYYSARLYRKYIYGFFLRFWIQSQLDLGIISAIQIYSIQDNLGPGFYVNLVLCVIVLCVFVLTPWGFILLILKNGNSVRTMDNDEFNGRWGVLFEEFKKNKSVMVSLFYTFFTCRRLFFVFCQVFLNSYVYVQASFNVGCSVLLLVYLVAYSPYKEIEVQISSVIGEVCTLEVLVLSLVFIGESDSDTIKNVETAIVFSVVITIILQSIISLYLIGKQAREIWIKRRNKNVTRVSDEVYKNESVPENTVYNLDASNHYLKEVDEVFTKKEKLSN